MTDRVYHGDGRGNWILVEYPNQCSEEFLFKGQCQGVDGHSGEHWRYRDDGSYEWAINKLEPTPDDRGVCGWTPPDHAEYINPTVRFGDRFLAHCTQAEVTDPAKIAILEADGELEDGATINRPCTREEIEDLIADGRIDPDDYPFDGDEDL